MRRGQRRTCTTSGAPPGRNIPYLCGVEDPYEQDVASLNSYSSWTVRYTASELTSLAPEMGGRERLRMESLTLTYSDLGNVIQVKVNYTNGESSTIRQRSTDLRNLFGLPSIRFTTNGAEAEPGFPLRREPERGKG